MGCNGLSTAPGRPPFRTQAGHPRFRCRSPRQLSVGLPCSGWLTWPWQWLLLADTRCDANRMEHQMGLANPPEPKEDAWQRGHWKGCRWMQESWGFLEKLSSEGSICLLGPIAYCAFLHLFAIYCLYLSMSAKSNVKSYSCAIELAPSTGEMKNSWRQEAFPKGLLCSSGCFLLCCLRCSKPLHFALQ